MIIGPRSKFQEDYLNSDARILIAGGAAGSSKSYIGLMRHLRWVEDRFYRGYCIRRNSTDIMKEGGLFDEAVDLYRSVYPDASPKTKDQKIVFPSGATVSFSHYENDKAANKWQGIQLSNVFYDEATHAEEKHIWWLISRLRTRAKLNPGIWLSCNPDPDSYLFNWVKWWLYPEGHEKFGLPDPEKNGKTRWILRQGGEIYWGDTKEELIIRYGKPNLGLDHPNQVKPLSFQVLLGTIFDNPTLIESQPEYLSNLESQPEVDRQRLLLGNWSVRPKGSQLFEREWVEEVSYVDESEVLSTVRAFDFAASLKSDINPSPDYSVSVRMRKMKDGSYLIDDIVRTRIRVGDWEQFVLDCASKDPSGTDYYIPQDPGAAAEKATKEFAQRLSQAGLYVKRARTNRSKIDRFRPFASMCQNGGVKILKGCGNDLENNIINDNGFYYKELESFTGERKRGESGHDDLCDSTSDCFIALATMYVSLSGISKGLKEFNNVMKVNKLIS